MIFSAVEWLFSSYSASYLVLSPVLNFDHWFPTVENGNNDIFSKETTHRNNEANQQSFPFMGHWPSQREGVRRPTRINSHLEQKERLACLFACFHTLEISMEPWYLMKWRDFWWSWWWLRSRFIHMILQSFLLADDQLNSRDRKFHHAQTRCLEKW